jgi:multidrug efflux pump subunit AcrB
LVLRHRFATLLVALGTLAATLYLYDVVPKGFLPQQDTGLVIGVTDAAQDVSFKAMAERQQAVAKVVAEDPDVASVASFVGTGTVNATLNTGRLYINLKPRSERDSSADEVIARLRDAASRVPGIALSRSTRASAARSTSTRWSMPTRPSSPNGRRASSTRCAGSLSSPTSPATSRRPASRSI